MHYNSGYDLRLYVYLGVGVVFGIVLFFKGFKNLKLKRLIENIPTSKIRSLPMGIVEIVGKALQTVDIKTPFSNMPCVFFQYLVEEYRRSGKHGNWVTIKRASSPYPFEVQDDTGKIAINPTGADVDIDSKHVFSNSFFQSLPPNARQFMDMNGINYRGFLGLKKNLRLTEYFIVPGAPIYVLGDARHAGKSMTDEPEYLKKQKRKSALVLETLRKLKKSPVLMKRYDLNGDGEIDQEEWEKAREDVAKWIDHNLTKEELLKIENIKVEIGKGDKSSIFFISDKSQKKLISQMAWKSSGFVFGGALLTVVCSGILLFLTFG